MKIDELMFGDIVDVHRYECVVDGGQYAQWNEYGKVVGITDSYITIKYIGREDDYSFEDVEEKDINPIPLGSEILKKNGFWYEHNVGYVIEEYGYEIIYSLWDHNLRILKNREQILNLDYLDEMCVHELQHILKLFNIDKEIEL